MHIRLNSVTVYRANGNLGMLLLQEYARSSTRARETSTKRETMAISEACTGLPPNRTMMASFDLPSDENPSGTASTFLAVLCVNSLPVRFEPVKVIRTFPLKTIRLPANFEAVQRSGRPAPQGEPSNAIAASSHRAKW